MNYKIKAPQGGLVSYTVNLPASKSISNRALILNALSYSLKPIKNISNSDDTKSMLAALHSQTNKFDVGAAGTTMRFLTAFLSKIVGEWYITGSERMKQRPIKILVDSLNSLGAKIEYTEKEGYPPLRIFGSALEGGELTLASDVSSQYISALLMIAPTMKNGLKLTLSGEIISKPYIHLTMDMMREYGVEVEMNKNIITVPSAEYKPVDFTVESDWSAASYWYQIVALNENSSVTLTGLKKYSSQGDSKVLELFNKLGIKSKFTRKGLLISNFGNKERVKSFNYNFIEQPDLAQTFAVTCCCLGIKFNFSGLKSLFIKETDRINALKTELRKMGFVLKSDSQGNLIWDGEHCEKQEQITIKTYKDHRMAMSFAPASSVFNNIIIEDIDVVSKSYPNYWCDLKEFGFSFVEV